MSEIWIIKGISWVAIPLVFVISILVPVFGDVGQRRHVVSIVLACTFTLTMVVYMFLALMYVAEHVGPEEYVVSGGTYIFEGTFVSDTPKAWILAFSRPQGKTKFNRLAGPGVGRPADRTETNEKEKFDYGFGAPLWVLFLAVIGASLLTVSVIINEIGERKSWDDADYLRTADQMIVRHQMFVLFAPLGAMFTYQALVAVGAAGKPITVGMAVLGAGATLPYLLDFAVKQSVTVLKGAGVKYDKPATAGTKNEHPEPVTEEPANSNKSEP